MCPRRTSVKFKRQPPPLPIQVYGVEGWYATALFLAASKQKTLDKVEQELGRQANRIKHPKLSSIVINPCVMPELKKKLSPVTVNLISVLAENGLLTLNPDVIAAFGKMMYAHRHMFRQHSAQHLNETNLTELKVALDGVLQKGETIKMETKVQHQLFID